MTKNSISATHHSSHKTWMRATFNVKIEMRIIDNLKLHILSDRATNLLTVSEPDGLTLIILRAYPLPTQKLSGIELTEIRVEKHGNGHDHFSKTKKKPNKFSRFGNVGRRLAEGGLWSIVWVIILKAMTLCEGVAGTVDFAQLAGQGLAEFRRWFGL